MERKKLLVMLSVAVLVVINIIFCAVQLGNTDKPDAVPEDQTQTNPSHDVDSPVSQTIEWMGWQSALAGVNGASVYDSHSFSGSPKDAIASGEQIIICQRNNDACLIRYGEKTGWVNASELELQGEPTVYQPDDNSWQPASLAGTDMAAQLDSVADKYDCIGVQMAIITDGKISHLYEYGYGNRGEKIPMSSDTKLRVASITKVIVGMGVMSMADMGIVDIDEDISRYWSQSIANPKHADTPITFRHLLTHTSSMKDFGYKKRETQALIDNLQKADSYMSTAPGDIASYKYNNSAICTAGALAGHAAGCNFDSYIRQYFYQSLGVDASFHAANIQAADLLSPTYNEGTTTMTVKDLLNVKYFGGPDDDYSLYAGGMIISAKDMAKLVCILIGGGQYEGMYYLKESTVDEMLRVHYETEDYDQCLVLRHQDQLLGGESLYYHNGNLLGVFSMICFDPETGDGMVVITNGAKNVKLEDCVYNVCGDLAETAKALWK